MLPVRVHAAPRGLPKYLQACRMSGLQGIRLPFVPYADIGRTGKYPSSITIFRRNENKYFFHALPPEAGTNFLKVGVHLRDRSITIQECLHDAAST